MAPPPQHAESYFRPGDLVQVRSAEEIVSTLDQDGALGGIPFMPEMAALCGQQFRVAKRAHKTCEHGMHRIPSGDVVHLAGVRCDGSAHGGCQYQCLIFWKEAWLKRAVSDAVIGGASDCSPGDKLSSLKTSDDDSSGRLRYRCQATEISRFSVPLRLRETSQFLQDLRSGNVGLRELRITVASAYDYICWLVYRFIHRKALREKKRMPTGGVHFKPDDLVRVKSRKEIFQTVDYIRTTRGLELSVDMLRFCGREFRVAEPVQRIIDVDTGYLKELKNECIVLEGVSCGGAFMMCPHNYYHFWRADWLEMRSAVRKEDSAPASASSEQDESVGDQEHDSLSCR
jgi:hypothetical protein